MKTLVLIPSRLSATRLPGKPLLKINGLSIISHVLKTAQKADIGEVFVATEDQDIVDDVKKNGGEEILTSNKHDADILRLMAYDGRDLSISPWQDQKVFHVGYHYKPSIEDCEKGLYMLANNKLKTKESQKVNYPDLSKVEIVK